MELYQVTGRLHKLELVRMLAQRNEICKDGLYAGQMPVLNYLAEHPGCTQVEMADFLQVSPASIALSTKRLQKAGMLEKRADEADMRRNHIELTERGRSTVARGRACYDQVVERMLRDFTGSEVDTLVSLLARLEENLAGDEYRGRTALSLAEAADCPAKSDGEEREHP